MNDDTYRVGELLESLSPFGWAVGGCQLNGRVGGSPGGCFCPWLLHCLPTLSVGFLFPSLFPSMSATYPVPLIVLRQVLAAIPSPPAWAPGSKNLAFELYVTGSPSLLLEPGSCADLGPVWGRVLGAYSLTVPQAKGSRRSDLAAFGSLTPSSLSRTACKFLQYYH